MEHMFSSLSTSRNPCVRCWILKANFTGSAGAIQCRKSDGDFRFWGFSKSMVKTTHLTFILVASQIYLWRRVQIISDLEAAAAPKDFGKLRWRAPRFLSGLGFSRIFYPKQNQMPSKPDSILWFHNSWREVEATRRGTAQDRVLEKEEQSPQLSASLVNPEQFVKGEREVKAMCFLKCKDSACMWEARFLCTFKKQKNIW